MARERTLTVALTTAAAALAFAACHGRFDAAEAPAKILLISIDTTRADHVSAYGYARRTTPFLEKLAARGVRFENAYAVMPTTDPSHTSILTGQYPRTHGIMRNAARRTDADAPSLASWLHDRGYSTAAITARIGLDPQLRRISGFDHTDAPRAPRKWRKAPEVARRALSWLHEREGSRWFLWVHLWEPHQPYEPPSGQRKRFALADIVDFEAYAEPERFLADGETISERDVARSASLYDGEIATADAAVAKIVRAAYAAKPDDSPPLILVVSDHGESLGERQQSRRIGFGHGVLLNREQVRVPWITVWESRLHEAVLRTYVSLVDLAPTVMDLVDPGKRYETEGRSLAASLLRAQEPPGRAFFLERRLFNSRDIEELAYPETALVAYPWKLIENDGVGRLELYDLASDPEERNDLAAERVEVTARLRERLAGWLDDHPLPRQQGAATRAEEQHRLREQDALRSLGYID